MKCHTLLALVAVLFGGGGLNADPPRTAGDGNPLPSGALFRLGSVRWRHGNGITNSALSPDDKLLATSSGRSVVVWDLASGKPRQRFGFDKDSRYSAPSLMFSADGSRLAHVRNGEFACVWEVATGKELRRFTAKFLSNDAFSGRGWLSQDGAILILGKHKRTLFLDVATGKEVRVLPEKVEQLSPDTKTFVRREKMAIHFGDTATGKEIGKLDVAVDDGIGNTIAFAPDSLTLAVVDRDKEVRVCAVPGGKVLAAFPLPASARQEHTKRLEYRLGFTRDGKTLWLATVGGFVHRWNLATLKELSMLAKHQGGIANVHDLPEGGTLISTGADGTIRHWNPQTGKELTAPTAFVGWTWAALSPDGRRAAIGDQQGRLELWDASTGKRLHVLQAVGPAVWRVAFTPDGKEVAAALASGVVPFWDVVSGKRTRALECAPEQDLSFVYTLRFSPEGRFLCICDNRYHLKWWDLVTGKPLWGQRGGTAAVTPDGKGLVTAFGGPYVRYLDAVSGKERFRARFTSTAGERLGTVSALAFAADGTWLAVGEHWGNVTLCDGATGREVRQFAAVDDDPFLARFGRGYSVGAVVFSPDGRWLATGATDTAVRLWETATGQELLRLDGHEGEVTGVAFGAGGRTLLSCGHDGQVLVWSLRPPPTRATLDQRWAELGAKEAKTVYRAAWALSADPKAAAFLRAKIVPVKPVPPERLKQWIDGLNSGQFKVRTAATEALAAAGDLARPALELALQKPPTAEVRARLVRLLEALRRGPTVEELRAERAVQALELADTNPGRGVLAEWASGAAGARLTRAARAALTRLEAKR